MVVLSTPTFDPDGRVELPRGAASDTSSITRRVTRIATLDGSAVLPDYGYSDADRTLEIESVGLSRNEYTALARLVKLYPMLVLSCADGIFYGAPQKIKTSRDKTKFTFLVKEALA
jgi:hypothetical protein